MQRLKSDGEDFVLQRIRHAFRKNTSSQAGKKTGGKFVALGIGDDAALLRPGKRSEIVLTCDWFLEGTHFLTDKHPADSIGWKCLARAVSDMAAMGGAPRCFLLSLALPNKYVGRASGRKWLEEFLAGLARAASRFGCTLAGGDTTERREVLINITVVGEVPARRAIRRSGSRPGDIIYVSGRLGEAELGLMLLQADKKLAGKLDARLRKHLYPEPRLELGRWLSEKGLATAMMDLSDGLSTDLRRLCEASKTGAVVHAAKLPTVRVPESGRKGGVDTLRLALHGGDDYELLFTVRKSVARRIPPSLNGLPITAIGEVTRGREVMLVGKDARLMVLEPGGWDPFRRSR